MNVYKKLVLEAKRRAKKNGTDLRFELQKIHSEEHINNMFHLEYLPTGKNKLVNDVEKMLRTGEKK